MRRTVILWLVFAAVLFPQQKKGKAEVSVLSATAYRQEGIIRLDGRVRNSGEMPVHQLILAFDFMAAGRQVITTQKGPVEAEVLEPGEETEFHLKLRDPVRAVEFRMNAEDGSGRDLKVLKGGPFPIE